MSLQNDGIWKGSVWADGVWAQDVWFESATATSANYYIPDPRWQAPELLTPGKKPVGPVEIDWSHPAAQYFETGLLFNETGTKTIGPWDVGWTNNSSNVSLGVDGGVYGAVIATNDTTDTHYLYDSDWLDVYQTRTGKNQMYGSGGSTIAFKFILHDLSPADDLGIFDMGGDDGSSGLYVFSHLADSGKLKCAYGNWVTHSTSGFSINANQWYSCVWRIKEDTSTELWVDGVSVDSAASSGTVSTSQMEIGRAFGGIYAHSLFGSIAHWYVYRQALPDAMCASLSRDPYQFLIPA